MATLVLGVALAPALSLTAGGTAAVAVGIAGGLLGAYLDSTFILPNLFPAEEPEPPDISGLALNSYVDGGPINFCLGPQNRIEGQVIWSSDPTVVIKKEPMGPKGSGGQGVVEQKILLDIAVAVCEVPVEGGKISEIKRIFAEGQEFYNDQPNVNIASNQLSATAFTRGYTYGPYLQPFDNHWLRISAPAASGVDLTDMDTGVAAAVTGFANGVNNNTRKVGNTWTDGAGDTHVEFFLGVDSAYPGNSVYIIKHPGGVTEAAGASVNIIQNRPKFKSDVVESITFYDGSQSAPDPLIESFEGVGEVSSWQGIAYFVLKNLVLNAFGGGRIPTFTSEVEAETSTTLGEAIEKILVRSDIGTDKFTLDANLSENLRGYNVRGAVPTTKSLQPLMIAYDVITRHTPDGKLHFFKRPGVQEFELLESDFLDGKGSGQSGSPRPFSTARVDKSIPPSKVEVTYLDTEIDLQQGMQSSFRVTYDVQKVQRTHFNIPLTPSEALNIAARLLWTQVGSGSRYSMTLSHRNLSISENDRIVWIHTAKDQDGNPVGEPRQIRALVAKVEKGQNLSLVIEATEDNPNAVIQNEIAEARPASVTGRPGFNTATDVSTEIFETYALDPLSHNNKLGLYIVACSTKNTDPFPGLVVKGRAFDSQAAWEDVTQINTPASIGYTTEAMQAPLTYPIHFEHETTLKVQMLSGVPKSETEDAVLLQNKNFAMVGNEVIAYKTATLQGDGVTWHLSGLLRGLQGTEHLLVGHAIGERFVILSDPGVHFIEFPGAAINSVRGLLLYPLGADSSLYSAEYHLLTGKTYMGWSPAIMSVIHDLAGNKTVTFFPRSRGIGDPLANPELTDQLLFQVDVVAFNGGEIVVNTYVIDWRKISDETEFPYQIQWTYTAAQQKRDGFTVGSAIRMDFYQINEKVGRGPGIREFG